MGYYVKINLRKMTQIRKEKKITQKELARRSGLSISTIQGYEQGRFAPKPDAVEKICQGLDINIEEIVEKEELASYDSGVNLMHDLYSSQTGHEQTILHHGPDGLIALAIISLEQGFSGTMDPLSKLTYKGYFLNEAGRQKAVELLQLLEKIPEYQRTADE